MKYTNFKTVTLMLSASALLALSGCGDDGLPSGIGIGVTPPPVTTPPVTPPDGNETIPPKDMTNAEAKDAMALNAFIYPILAPLTNVANCLVSTENLLGCLADAAPATEPTSVQLAALQPGTYDCTPGTPANGTYTYGEVGDTRTFTFNEGCADYGNSQDLHTQLVVKSCFLGLEPEPDSGTPLPDGTYRVEYQGSVECAPTKKTANAYVYRTIGNNNNQTKAQWSYDGTFDFGSDVVSINASVRGIAKYAVGDDTPETSWDNLFLGSDEEWKFESFSVALGNTMTFNGKGTYIKYPNDNNNGDGSFYLDFASLAYALTHNGTDIMANVSGEVSATCHPVPVTYATTQVMEDINNVRDSLGYRMPSSGSMTSAIPGYNPAPAVFSEASGNAQVAITSGEGVVTYSNWREIVAGSSCNGMQEFMDTIIQPKPPVVPPVAGEIFPENVLFDDDAAFVLAPDKLSATGETAGRSVWYYLQDGQGYVEGQTVGQTTFQFSIPVSPVPAFVNVYLYDETGAKQRISIYDNAGWNTFKSANPLWTIRTDYIEADWPSGTIFQGNFILRIGDSSYTGTGEAFTIGKYLVEPIIPVP